MIHFSGAAFGRLEILFMPLHIDSGFEINAPTMEVNRRRHQAFITSRKICPPSIRHQDLKILEVDWDAPMENTTGAV